MNKKQRVQIVEETPAQRSEGRRPRFQYVIKLDGVEVFRSYGASSADSQQATDIATGIRIGLGVSENESK